MHQTTPEANTPSRNKISPKWLNPISFVIDKEPSPNLMETKDTNGPIQVGKHMKQVNSL